MPSISDAAGLGKLNVISGLGEPLNAEIELISTTPEELSSLTAAIAPAEAYSAQGLERPAISSAIKIDVDRRAGGNPVLKLTTRQAVTDPFLDMLIQLDWASGRLLREYTVLLDPPGYNSPTAPAAGNAPLAGQGDAPVEAQPAPLPTAPFSDNAQAQAASPQTHTTARGDTLNAIAQEMQVQGVSLERMLVGLYRANEQAFEGGNMNRLKVGQIIRAPSPEDLQSIGQREAVREIRAQTADWNAYRNRLAGIVAEGEASEGDTSGQSASGRLSGPAEDRAAPPADTEQDVVKLSKSAESGSDQSQQDRLNALQEEVIARENSLKEANERTAALEKQIQDLQELLEIKNQTLANMQQGGVEQNAPAPKADGDTAKLQENKPAGAAQPAGKPAAAPAQTASGGLLDDLLQNQLLPVITLVVLLVLVVIWLLLRNKRRRELDSFEKGILTASGLKANTVFGNTAGNTIDTGDTSFLTDFSQSAGGMIDTHDVDPIAEAEVYMAYGRDAQAEEILKDAIAKEPKRYELHLKLLEIFAARNDAAAFETVAGELYSTLGAADPIWSKVAETGRKLEPDNPLYAIPATSVEPPPVEAQVDDRQDALADAERAGATDLDFSLDNDKAGSSVANSLASPASSFEDDRVPALDDVPTLDLSQPRAAEAENAKQPADDNTLDFELRPVAAASGLDDVSNTQDDERRDDELPNFDVPELTLESPKPTAEAEVPAQLQEVSLDFPPIEMPESPSETIAPEKEPADTQPQGLYEDIFTQEQALSPDEHIVIEPPPVREDEGDEFDEEDAPAAMQANAELPELDLSSISLDLDDDRSADEPEPDAVSAETEPTEVDTKLDLVGAYIDMDDIEGARELLEEVLKEGGPNQRERARKLLDSLA